MSHARPLPSWYSWVLLVLSHSIQIESILSAIETFNATVSQISTVHQRTLSTVATSEDSTIDAVTALTRTARSQSNSLVRRVERLFGSLFRGFRGSDAERNMRRNRAALVKKKLMDSISEFQWVEMQNRARTRERVERQIRVGERSTGTAGTRRSGEG